MAQGHQIPEGGRAARGKAIVNLLEMEPNERIQAVLPIKEFKENEYVLMATAKGVIKKTSLMAFSHPMKTGIIALKIDEGDSLIQASLTNGAQHAILVTQQGQSIRFDETEARPMGRAARGVVGIRLDNNDKVIGMAVVTPGEVGAQVLTVTEKGYGEKDSH